jgi:hypothetical protein
MSFVGQRRAFVRPLIPHLAWEGVLLVVLLLVIVVGKVAEAAIVAVSVYGGQGPIFGVVLASGIAAVIGDWNALAGRASWSQLVLAGVLILVGLLVSWVIGFVARRVAVTP